MFALPRSRTAPNAKRGRVQKKSNWAETPDDAVSQTRLPLQARTADRRSFAAGRETARIARYGSGMLATAEVRCTTCDTTVIVFPHTLYGIVPSSVRAALVAEAARTETDGKRFTVADETGAWTCPACSARSIITVVDFN